MARLVFLHGLESRVDDRFIPTGGKARHLAAHYDVTLAPLDTRVAQACARRLGPAGFRHPFPEEDACFATPMQRARDSLAADTQLVIGSSFGGAVLLRLIHEGSWSGRSLFLAGAGVKLTPHRTLPAGVPCHLVHGRSDAVVPGPTPSCSPRAARMPPWTSSRTNTGWPTGFRWASITPFRTC